MSKPDKYSLILTTAHSILVDEGLEALSINKVAQKAGIAKGTVYIYFDSKEEIIGALTVKARNVLLDYFHKYCGDQTDPIEKIKAIFWADYYFFREHPTYHELVSFYEKNTGLTESGELAQTSVDISGFIKGLLDDAQRKELIRSDIDTHAMTYVFWGMAVGILQLLETKQPVIQQYLKKSDTSFFAYFVDSTVNGLLS